MSTFRLKGVYVSLSYVGEHFGKPALYLDVYGCNRECTYCNQNYYHHHDKYSTRRFIYYDENDILYIVSEFDYKYVVIGGSGEPTLYDFTNLILDLREAGYHVTIETNGKKYSKILEVADTVVFNIKTFSAGFPYTNRQDLDWYKENLNNTIFTCTIKSMKDIDYLATNFKDYDIWLFLEFNELDFNPYLDKIIHYPNWRISYRPDVLLNLDFRSIHEKRLEELL